MKTNESPERPDLSSAEAVGSAIVGSTVIPSARYRDAPAAIAWLCKVIGFEKKAVYEGPNGTVAHAELVLGKGMFMLGSASNASPYPEAMAHPDEMGGRVSGPFYVAVEECAPVYTRAQEAGAEILQTLRTMDYGGGAFTVRDPEGYVWSVGEYDPWK
ncbi:MAG: VOC family protein [Acidobacteriaceae bacterium]